MSNLQIELNPQEIQGKWRAGYALDFYSVPILKPLNLMNALKLAH